MNPLFLILIVPAVKFLINGAKYLQTIYYYKKYMTWADGGDIKLNRMQHNIVKLFKEAGIHDHYFSDVTPLSNGYMQSTTNISLFDNLNSRRKDHISIVWKYFEQALGVYKTRTWESINPIYWLEIIVYLPKHLAAYLGYSQDKLIVKMISLVYWAFIVLIPAAYFYLGTDFRELVTILKDYYP